MTDSAQTLPAGWSLPGGARKWHYFLAGDAFSLCGRYGFNQDTDRADENHDSPENCAECMRRRERLAPSAPAAGPKGGD